MKPFSIFTLLLMLWAGQSQAQRYRSLFFGPMVSGTFSLGDFATRSTQVNLDPNNPQATELSSGFTAAGYGGGFFAGLMLGKHLGIVGSYETSISPIATDQLKTAIRDGWNTQSYGELKALTVKETTFQNSRILVGPQVAFQLANLELFSNVKVGYGSVRMPDISVNAQYTPGGAGTQATNQTVSFGGNSGSAPAYNFGLGIRTGVTSLIGLYAEANWFGAWPSFKTSTREYILGIQTFNVNAGLSFAL